MSQTRTDLLISFLLMLLLIWVVWEARDWPERTRFFPWAMGFPLLGLALLHLGIGIWKDFRQRVNAGISSFNHEVSETDKVETKGFRQRMLTITIWAVVFAMFLWVLGFKVGGPLVSIIFLRFQAQETWLTTSLYGLGVYLFFFAGLETGLGFPLPSGLLATALELQSFDWYVVYPILSKFGF